MVRLAFAHGSGSPTSFYEVLCSEGFECVSRVEDFGIGHYGELSAQARDQALSRVLPRYDKTYEVGCPARGGIVDGFCRTEGAKGGQHFCYSDERFEAGPQAPCDTPEKCFCVRRNADSGNTVQAKQEPKPSGLAGAFGFGSEAEKSSKAESSKATVPYQYSENIEGDEVRMGRYLEEPPNKCGDCRQFDNDNKSCDECLQCEYTTRKTVEGKQTGCFRDVAQLKTKATEEGGRIFLEGEKLIPKDLAVVPHYKIWDPGFHAPAADPDDEPTLEETEKTEADELDKPEAHPYEFPYQSPALWLPRREWVEQYKEKAPVVQLLMDWFYSKATKEWGPKAKTLRCFSPASEGDDVPGKIVRLLRAQRGCREMQQTAAQIAGGVEFPSVAMGKATKCIAAENPAGPPSGTGGKEAAGKSEGGGGGCAMLNCYAADQPLEAALDNLQKRSAECQTGEILGAEPAAPAGVKKLLAPAAVSLWLPPITGPTSRRAGLRQLRSRPNPRFPGATVALGDFLCKLRS